MLCVCETQTWFDQYLKYMYIVNILLQNNKRIQTWTGGASEKDSRKFKGHYKTYPFQVYQRA